MKIINKTKGMIDKFSGMTRKMMRNKSNIPFDGMQKYMTVGEYIFAFHQMECKNI